MKTKSSSIYTIKFNRSHEVMKIGGKKGDLDYGPKILEKIKGYNKTISVLYGKLIFTKIVRSQTKFTLLILLLFVTQVNLVFNSNNWNLIKLIEILNTKLVE